MMSHIISTRQTDIAAKQDGMVLYDVESRPRARRGALYVCVCVFLYFCGSRQMKKCVCLTLSSR